MSDLEKIRKNADKGDPEAQYKFGLVYFKGDGVRQDYDEAYKWILKAAEQGYILAHYMLPNVRRAKYRNEEKKPIGLHEEKIRLLDEMTVYSEVLVPIMCALEPRLREGGVHLSDPLVKEFKKIESLVQIHIADVQKKLFKVIGNPGFRSEMYRHAVHLNAQRSLAHAECLKELVSKFGHSDIAEQANKVFVEASKLREMFGNQQKKESNN